MTELNVPLLAAAVQQKPAGGVALVFPTLEALQAARDEFIAVVAVAEQKAAGQ